MVELWRVVIGAGAVLLGLAWIAAPLRMSRLQARVLYRGQDDEIGDDERDALIGRVSGIVLAILGVVLASGFRL